MSDIAQNIAQNLSFLRKSRGLTQIALAQRSGIPRTTLSYLESGHGNPSLKILMTLASILGVTLEELIRPPRPLCLLLKRADQKKLMRVKGKAIITPLLPDPIPGIQFERLTLKPQTLMVGTPHSKGTKEYFTCVQGRISIYVEDEKFLLDEEDVLSFPGDRKHSYHNQENYESKGISIVVLEL